ncbi:hypothetical protein [Alicyclobacillus fastidiosus]|uniref:Uncharacterized protein n=1 Tax=Alicyclobacillus fastidiosus TaxID=392011 RepID=A0ABV5AEN2_9BACL|nr:hypothetical protein [Alicyclobacillus fastidiosus]WEH09531.1 hypothetical protein PYS47_23315 [Alicyclobacillus fastidiosus]
MVNQTAQQANALLFLTDLKSDQTLFEQWNDLLTKANAQVSRAKSSGETQEQVVALYRDIMQVADNFLADHGYDTTAEVVLQLLKSPMYQDYLAETSPNSDSDRFVQALLTNASVFKAWQAHLQNVASGGATTASLDAYLHDAGYQCTFLQVNASFVKIRNHNMNYWAGSYVTAIQTGSDETPADTKGPVVVVYGNNRISVNQDEPNKLFNRLTYDNGQLSWKANMSVKYAGTFVFSEITAPSKEDNYAGPIFSGTLSWAEDDPIQGRKKGDMCQLYGRLSQISQQDEVKNLPANADPTTLDEILKWVNYLLVGFAVLKTVMSIGKKYLSVPEFQKASDNAFQEKIDEALPKMEAGAKDIEAIGRSPFAQFNIEGSSVLKDIQAQMDAATGAEKQALQQEYVKQQERECEFDEAPEVSADPGGDGWGSDLEDLGRLVI